MSLPTYSAAHRPSLPPAQLTAAVTAVAVQALACIDLRHHDATHPRLGAVDHISCHPLGPGASLEQAAQLAVAIGAQLSQPPASLPTYLYGAAHPAGASLADIRRRLGYFQAASSGNGGSSATSPAASQTQQQQLQHAGQGAGHASLQYWAGAATGADLSCPPDLGPSSASASAGVLTLGAVPWLVNFNVPLQPGASMDAARRLARAVSERGGGLPGVEVRAGRVAGGRLAPPGVARHVLGSIQAAVSPCPPSSPALPPFPARPDAGPHNGMLEAA